MCSFHRRLYLVSLIGASVLLLFGFSVNAQAVTIEAVKVTNSTGGTVFDTIARSAPSPQYPAAPTRNHIIRNVPMSPGTLGKLGRGALGGPLGFAVGAAMVAADFYWSEQKGEYVTMTEPEYWSTFWAAYNQSSSYRGVSSYDSCRAYAEHQTALSDNVVHKQTFTCSHVIASGTSPQWERWEVEVKDRDGSHPDTTTTYTARKFNGEYVVDPKENTATDVDYAEAIKAASAANNLAQQLADLLVQTSTPTQLEEAWPELNDRLIDLRDAIRAEQDHLTDPETYPEPVTLPEDIAEDTKLPFGFEWPDFCTWASFVCEPFTEDPHPDMPIMDIEEQSFDSGLPSGASCPAPVAINTSFGNWEISMQPFCDMAAAINGPLQAISYLVAAFIVVGVRR